MPQPTITELGTGCSPDASPTRRPGLVLAVLVAFQLMVGTDLTVANIAMPAIEQDLGFSTVDLAWVINAYTLSFGGLLLLGGRIGDVFGRRPTFVTGVVMFTVASLLAGMATFPGGLLAARVVQGMGSALAAPSALALITSNFEEGSRRSRAIGIYAAAGTLGVSVGLILGGVLTDWASWRWVLWINIPVGIAVVVVTLRFVRDAERQTGRLDIVGAVTSTIGVTALVYGFIRASAAGWQDGWTLTSFVLAVLLLVLFVLVELRTREPITPLHLFRHRDRNLVYAMTMLLVATVLGSFFFLVQFLQEVLDYSPLRTGFAFLPLTGAVLALSGLMAHLAEQVGPRTVIAVGMVLVLGATLWITLISASTAYVPGVLGPLVLFGVGLSANIGPLTASAMRDVKERDTGAASGLFQVMQQFGSSIGLAILVTVFDTTRRNVAGSSTLADPTLRADEALAAGISAAYVVGSLFAATGVVLALMLGRRHR